MNSYIDDDFVVIEDTSYSLIRRTESWVARYVFDRIVASAPRIIAYGVMSAVGTGTAGGSTLVYILAAGIRYGLI